MDPLIQAELLKEEVSPFHKQMLAECQERLAMSRSAMQAYYGVWDRNDAIYRNRQEVDEQDQAAAKRKEPIKMIVPVGYSQVQSFVSFGMSLFTQRERFFELTGIGSDDQEAAKVGEAFLDRDLRKNIWEARLYQYLLDVARFGVGIIKTCWSVERGMRLVKKTALDGITMFTAMESVLEYAGNRIYNVSPYQFFPDPRLPISRFQEGEFVAMEQVYSRHTLKQWEKNGVIAGLTHVPKVTKQMIDIRGESRVFGLGRNDGGALTATTEDTTVILCEMQRTLIPSEVMIDDKPLGPEDYPIKYDIVIANDARIVKCERSGYLHGEYTFDVGEYNPDVLNFSNPSLLDPIMLLQDTLSWFVNSRITNVRKIIGDRLIVDPSGVEMSDIKERSPVIRLKTGVSKQGVDKFIKQLDLVDVTTSHITDAQVLKDFIQQTTGINDTLMGEVATGRRSATENRNSTSAAAARLKMILLLQYRLTLEPMARKMLSNLRDGLDEMQVVRLVGQEAAANAAGTFIKANKADLIGEYDFEMFDGTLPSERHLNAQALQELLSGFISNPQAALALQIDPHRILKRWLELRGFRHPELFFLPAIPQQPQQNGQPGLTPGVPSTGTPPGPTGAQGEPILPSFGGGGDGQAAY